MLSYDRDAFQFCLSARQLVSICSPPVDLRFNSRTLLLVSVIYLWQIPWNTLNQKQSVISKPETVDLFTVGLQCDLELLRTLLLCRRRSEGRSSIPDFFPSLGSQGWREGARVLSEKRRGYFKIRQASVLFAWLMSPWCRSSHLMYLRLLRTFRFVRFDWVWDLWGPTCKRCAPGLREPETVYLCLTRGNSL